MCRVCPCRTGWRASTCRIVLWFWYKTPDTTHYDLEIPSQLRLSNLAYEEVVAEEVGCYKLHIPSIIVDSDHLLVMV